MSNDKKLTMENTTNQQDEKGHDANIVLAVSGISAIDFLRQEIKKYEPFTPFGLNKLPCVLYDAVAQAMENYHAACASGAVAKTVSVGNCLGCGNETTRKDYYCFHCKHDE